MPKIILATNNQHKLKEFTELFKNAPFTLNALNAILPKETGATFLENALIKARFASQVSGLPAIADDSGLVIDALAGKPGIYSARFAGENATYAANINQVLTLMQDIPEEKRTAHFHCVLVYIKYATDPAPIIAEGIWQGKILFTPRGVNGFGYDPIFFVPTHNCSAAELASTIKNKISHRGLATQKLLNLFSSA